MSIGKTLISIVTSLLMALLLVSCGAPTVNINFNSSPYLNPDDQNNSLPVQVKVFQLSRKNEFLNASFRDLWLDNKAILGDSLLQAENLSINPNSKKQIQIEPNKKVKYIGVIAIYRNPKGSQWRVIQKLPNSSGFTSQGVIIQLQGSTIHVAREQRSESRDKKN